jgi:hypothetical protein
MGFGTENPPLPSGPLLIADLSAACLAYELDLHNYTKAVRNFREAIGIDPGLDESSLQIDLARDDHCRHLIDLFLNPWQCRLPNPERRETDLQKRAQVLERYARTYAGLADWWLGSQESLPDPSLRLAAASDDDMKRCNDLYEALCDVQVADEKEYKRKAFGEVAASKTLYILRPHLFIAWDDDTQKFLGFPDGGGCGRFYVRFLQRARGRIWELRDECETRGASLAELPRIVAAEASRLDPRVSSRKLDDIANSTVAELMNRYYWIRVPRKATQR